VRFSLAIVGCLLVIATRAASAQSGEALEQGTLEVNASDSLLYRVLVDGKVTMTTGQTVSQRVATTRRYTVVDSLNAPICTDTVTVAVPYEHIELVCDVRHRRFVRRARGASTHQ